jgi:hypothetical protein
MAVKQIFSGVQNQMKLGQLELILQYKLIKAQYFIERNNVFQ